MLAAIAAALILVHDARSAGDWHWTHVTAYSTTENLTGCHGYNAHGEHVCGTACRHPWGLLHDWQFTVAANPRLGLACGTRLRFCGGKVDQVGARLSCHDALVTDRTASFFDFELSRALAYATGAPHADFGTPRWLLWRRL